MKTFKICKGCDKNKRIQECFEKVEGQSRYYDFCIECQKKMTCLYCGKPILEGMFCKVKGERPKCKTLFDTAKSGPKEVVPPIPDECAGRPVCGKYCACFVNYFADYKKGCWTEPKYKQIYSKAINPAKYAKG